ncbi:hypothetical protein [Streptomyces sp. NPDC049881]|uniref:hypothetical protein n=1 Tax=unclassified Streptomyces TaxID=2593676 RepID=UPI003437B3B4
MPFQTTAPAPLATQAELTALTALTAAPETEISGAPVHSPEASGLLLLLLLLSPREPKEFRK